MAENTVRIEISIETVDNTGAGTESVEKNLKKMADTAEKTADRMKKAADSISKYDRAAAKARESMDRATQASSKFDRAVERSQRTLSQWAKEKYEVLLEAKDRVTPILQKINPTLKGLGGKAWTVTVKALDLATAPIRGILNLIKKPFMQGGTAAWEGLTGAVDTYAAYERIMSRVKVLSGANAEEMQKLSQKAKEMGTATRFSGTEVADTFAYMAQEGWGVQDMLDGIQGLLSLSAAGDMEPSSAAELASNTLTAFGMPAKDSGQLADVMAATGSASKTDVQELGEAFKAVAPIAGAMKYSIQDVSLALGIMGNHSVKGSMAGTSLKTSLENMAAPTDAMAAAMEKYGISLTDNQGNMKTLRGVMDNLRQGLGGLSESEQTAAASTIFGQEAMDGMLSIVNASEEEYKKLAEQIDHSEGSADRMAETMQDNLAGALEQLGGAVETAQLTLGERLKPYIQSAATWLTEIMPEIEKGLDKFMDYADTKIEQIKRKIKSFTSTEEWANADLFGKIKISWDELIAEPFSAWWESSGRDMLTDAAGSIGNGIGTAVSIGLLALLGIDIQGAVGEGTSIGSAFASGLIEGFDIDAIQEKLWGAVQGIFGNAAKILPGGEKADLSSWLSAAMIAKVGMPILSMGGSIGKAGWNLGKGIYQSAKSGLLKKVIGSFSLAGELSGTGMATGSGLAGMLGKTGMMLGSGATTSGGMMMAGAGGATGALIGGATLISGGMDLYKGFTSDDEEEAEAYKTSGAMKMGGVAAGAAIGTVILPGVGTLIGAGIGGVIGWLGGDKAIEDFEESQREAEKAKYETQALKDAIDDADISAEEFGKMFQEAVGEKLQSSFGEVKLSLKEISELAGDIVFAGEEEQVNKFSSASTESDGTFSSYQAAGSSLEKLNWKIGVSHAIDGSDAEEYQAAIDSFVEGAKSYVEDRHYEATIALDLLLGEDGSGGLDTSLNGFYGNLQGRIESLSNDLTAHVNVALEDGVITLDEQEEILNLQNQIAEIMNKVSAAEMEASFESMKIKYTGADLDYDSFSQMQQELQGQVESLNQSYDEALKVGITNLQLELSEGAISQEEYNQQLAALTEGYHAKLDGLEVRVENFQLEAIANSKFGEELEGILPNLEGTVAERLGQAMHNAMDNGVDVANWDQETAAKWLGLESLSSEAQAAIATMISQVAATLPEDAMAPISETLARQMKNAADSMWANLAGEGGTAVDTGVGEAIEAADLGSVTQGVDLFYNKTQSEINQKFSMPFTTNADVNVNLNWNLLNPIADINVAGGGSTTVSAGIGGHARGGFVSGRQLSWVGEEGPEAIIPLVPSRRGRALELYERTGELLGLGQYANGGIVDGWNLTSPVYEPYTGISEPEIDSIGKEENPQPGENQRFSADAGKEEGRKISVSVSVNPTFQISGATDETEVLAAIRRNMRELADELGGQIAENIETIFENTPVRKGA